jgi:hypothetical protein
MDDSRCSTWWTDSIDDEKTDALPTAVPSQNKLDMVQGQIDLSKAFPQAALDGATDEYSCAGITSGGLDTVPRYLAYVNPNSGERHVESIACVPYGTLASPYEDLKLTDIAKDGDFAIFGIVGCDDHLETKCELSTSPGVLSVGPIEFTSEKYGGSRYPNHNRTHDKIAYNTSWNIIVILLAIVFIALMIILYMATRGPKSVDTCLPKRQPHPHHIENTRYHPHHVENSYTTNSVLDVQPGAEYRYSSPAERVLGINSR